MRQIYVFQPIKSLVHMKKIEKEGPPKLSKSDHFGNQRMMDRLWHDRNGQYFGKLVLFWASVAMSVLSAIGWLL